MYNPWSICCYMKEGDFRSYWINTASNEVIGELIRKHSPGLKREMEELLAGRVLHKRINEDVAYQYLDGDEDSFWSLLLATGYIKADNVVKSSEYTECDISITNRETAAMFSQQILKMFRDGNSKYSMFVDAILNHQLDYIQYYLEDLTYSSVSYFDTGKLPSKRIPENFYHGLVLGLLVSLKDSYRILSNRESGAGRYDISVIPKDIIEDSEAFIMEFKIRDPKHEKSLEETAQRAMAQIREKRYGEDLINQGIRGNRIYLLGFAFEGKEVEVTGGFLV
ncbi:MAG: PD-(D/E)XK nuclease domain-containing protein [Lachnospiraceae bacterium]|nr:PD-(D/E)XK nuclease domain-containing protein [Lachnospiraceae bacterium]